MGKGRQPFPRPLLRPPAVPCAPTGQQRRRLLFFKGGERSIQPTARPPCTIRAVRAVRTTRTPTTGHSTHSMLPPLTPFPFIPPAFLASSVSPPAACVVSDRHRSFGEPRIHRLLDLRPRPRPQQRVANQFHQGRGGQCGGSGGGRFPYDAINHRPAGYTPFACKHTVVRPPLAPVSPPRSGKRFVPVQVTTTCDGGGVTVVECNVRPISNQCGTTTRQVGVWNLCLCLCLYLFISSDLFADGRTDVVIVGTCK